MQDFATLFETIPASPLSSKPSRRREDFVLAELIDGFAGHGGLATRDEIVAMMCPYWRQPIFTLAKWVHARKVFTFTNRSQVLVPLFQFERPRMMPYSAVAEVAVEIADLLEETELAAWFLRPSKCLAEASPADVLASHGDRVTNAARATHQMLQAQRQAT
jgi:hypothetical protein